MCLSRTTKYLTWGYLCLNLLLGNIILRISDIVNKNITVFLIMGLCINVLFYLCEFCTKK